MNRQDYLAQRLFHLMAIAQSTMAVKIKLPEREKKDDGYAYTRLPRWRQQAMYRARWKTQGGAERARHARRLANASHAA